MQTARSTDNQVQCALMHVWNSGFVEISLTCLLRAVKSSRLSREQLPSSGKQETETTEISYPCHSQRPALQSMQQRATSAAAVAVTLHQPLHDEACPTPALMTQTAWPEHHEACLQAAVHAPMAASAAVRRCTLPNDLFGGGGVPPAVLRKTPSMLRLLLALS